MVPQTLVNLDYPRRFSSNPRSLHIQHFQQCVIVLVQQDGSTSGLLELHRTANVVNVRVCDDDLFKLELVIVEDGKDSLDLIARIDDQRFACALVANDRAVTAENADGEDLVDHY